MKNKGILIVISGPSGVGKGTVISKFINDKKLNLKYSVSMTTRKPRANEVDGEHYHFVSKEEFKQAIENGELLEWAEFVDNYYGTPIKQVEEQLNNGYNVILELEVVGCTQVREKRPNSLTIFITPPSMEELRNRIEKRSSEPLDVIQQRLSKAEKEMELLKNYKYVVCNDDPVLASDIISLIIERTRELERERNAK